MYLIINLYYFGKPFPPVPPETNTFKESRKPSLKYFRVVFLTLAKQILDKNTILIKTVTKFKK